MIVDDANDDFTLEEPGKPYGIKHRCFFFAKSVILFIKGSKYDRIYFSIFEQLLRSATSIGANVVEGSAGSSKKDWLKFLIIALKSANETKYWLCLIRDTIECDKTNLPEMLSEADELSRIIASIIIKSGK
ncbi:MAG: four helix bundle protein [Chitinophagaceae bacterium]